MTAAQQWIDSARSLTQPSSVPLGVPITRHMDMLLRDTQRDLRSALDALEKVLARHTDFGGYCGGGCGMTWPCPTVRTIESALSIEAGDDQ